MTVKSTFLNKIACFFELNTNHLFFVTILKSFGYDGVEISDRNKSFITRYLRCNFKAILKQMSKRIEELFSAFLRTFRGKR